MLTWLGIGIYAIGHGMRGLPNFNMVGCSLMIVGGVLIIVGAVALHG